jgi:hypothetical protein
VLAGQARDRFSLLVAHLKVEQYSFGHLRQRNDRRAVARGQIARINHVGEREVRGDLAPDSPHVQKLDTFDPAVDPVAPQQDEL